MKQWLDEKGKLFGLINPIDLVVILVLFALGIKVISDFRPASLRLQPNPVTLHMVIKDAPSYLADNLQIKEEVYQDRTNVFLGTIAAITTRPAEVLLNNNGKLQLAKSPQNLDVRLEVKRNGEVITGSDKSGVYLGKITVRVGETIECHTAYTALKGEIEAIETGRAKIKK